jgi:hypothetical protein
MKNSKCLLIPSIYLLTILSWGYTSDLFAFLLHDLADFFFDLIIVDHSVVFYKRPLDDLYVFMSLSWIVIFLLLTVGYFVARKTSCHKGVILSFFLHFLLLLIGVLGFFST